ncbi:MAG: hypothetical protein S4CHLAM6_04340 [Chlamydiae bacterium]|nr:hypothetical protein [Chlamydiota bacterium]
MILQSVIPLSHAMWKNILVPTAYTIDATCGNGHDTLFLSQLTLSEAGGKLMALDIQPKAIENTKNLLKSNLKEKILQNISLISSCHSQIDLHCPKGADLIVYNLGYLPGASKTITTQTETTIISLQKSLSLLKKEGHLSVTCYPGHEEGQIESSKVLHWAKSLGAEYICCQHQWINRSEKSPFIIMICKK